MQRGDLLEHLNTTLVVNNSSGQSMHRKKPRSVLFLDSECQQEQGSSLGVFLQFILFFLGLADSCLANNIVDYAAMMVPNF